MTLWKGITLCIGLALAALFFAAPPALLIWQERIACPSTNTVHAPQSPSPQPNLVPVRLAPQRSAHSKGVCGSMRNSSGKPLTVRVDIAEGHACVGGDVQGGRA